MWVDCIVRPATVCRDAHGQGKLQFSAATTFILKGWRSFFADNHLRPYSLCNRFPLLYRPPSRLVDRTPIHSPCAP